MHTTQALVAIGGRAARLRSDGVSVSVSKAFINVAGQPLLYWCLLSLHAAGVNNLVLAADRRLQAKQAEIVLERLPVQFDEARFFFDKGYGVHGLPYYVRKKLAEQYLFECGHTVTPPGHYHQMDALKEAGVVVFSAFRPHLENIRYPVRLVQGEVKRGTPRTPGEHILAHPLLVDKGYGHALPDEKFNIVEVINSYSARGMLRYVLSDMPPEFDIAPEMHAALSAYERVICRLLELPWDRRVDRHGGDLRVAG